MNGIIININPVIFQLGGLEVRWYSLFIVTAIISAVLIAAHVGKRKGILPENIYSLAIWAVGGGILGARLFHVIDKFGYYLENPSQIIQFQGLAIWGALIGGGIAVLLFSRIKGIPLGKLVDTLAPGLLVAQIIGRFGCIVNGDAYGGVTDLPWGFIYRHPNAMIPAEFFGVPTHPYPVYEIIWNSLVLLAIWKLRRYFKTDGLVFFSYIAMYALGRFILTFVRQENTFFWGLQQAQILALSLSVVATVLLIYLPRRYRGNGPAKNTE